MYIDRALRHLRLEKRRVSGNGLVLNVHFDDKRVAEKVSKCALFMDRFKRAGGVVNIMRESMTMNRAKFLLHDLYRGSRIDS